MQKQDIIKVVMRMRLAVKRVDAMLKEAKEIYTKEPARGCEICLEALQLTKDYALEEHEGEVLLQLITSYRMVSKYEDALDCAEKARSLFMRRHNKEGLMRLNNLLGILYFYNGIFDVALHHLYASYNYAKEINYIKLMVSTLNNIGEVRKKAGDYDSAMEYFEEAAYLAKKEKLDFYYGVIVQNIGDVYMLRGELDEAEHCFNTAYAYYLEQGEITFISELHLNLGKLYLKNNETQRARSYFEYAISKFEEINNKFYIVDVLVELYKLDANIDLNKALDHLTKAKAIAEESRIELKLSEIEHIMYHHYEKEGDFEHALYHFKKYHNLLQKLDANNLILKLKILKIETDSQSTSLNENYASEIMTHEIEHEREKIKQLELQNADLSYKAMHDKLTKLPNRRRIDKEFQNLARYVDSQDGEANIGIFMLDIDHFKLVNDNMGHLFGDACLESISRALSKVASKYNGFIGRFGGEEFIFVRRNLDLYKSNKIAQELNACINDLQIEYTVDGAIKKLTISVGGLYCTHIKVFDKHKLIELADKALYIAKAEGRNQSVLHRFEEVEHIGFVEVSN